ncbi:uncharacterized protein LOC118437323 isoform X2 [Folsomia candida]|uniref:uncharacterized protein LOC118437323 isoform X2 n=1 Tax=Folsomia candida TaxID=158441 RepID=UPI0016055C59|nr:uncharacterized protein LOC118437323 isoform X2 [Folsomia candida]
MAHETTDPTCLTGAMSHLFDTGLFSDVAFLVGKEKHRFNVHRMILGGRSPVFATMLEERWAQQQTRTDSDFRDKVFIRFQEYDVESFRIFLKFLYTDWLSPVNLGILLDLLKLAHLYEIPRLLRIVVDRVKEYVAKCDPKSANDCLTIYKHSRHIDEKLGELSFQFFMKHVRLAGQNNRYLSWDTETVRHILHQDVVDVREVDIFKALLNWAKCDGPSDDDKHSEKAKVFPQLLKMIRFPAMGIKDFGSEVVPTQVLSQDEVVKMFLHFSNPGENSTMYNTTPRQKVKPVSFCSATGQIPDFAVYQSKLVRPHITMSKVSTATVDQLPPEIRLEVTSSICLTGIKVASSDLWNRHGNEFKFIVLVKIDGGLTVAKGEVTITIPNRHNPEYLVWVKEKLALAEIPFDVPLTLQRGKFYEILVHCKQTTTPASDLMYGYQTGYVVLCRRSDSQTYSGFREEERNITFANNVMGKLKCLGGLGSRWIGDLVIAPAVSEAETPTACPITQSLLK